MSSELAASSSSSSSSSNAGAGATLLARVQAAGGPSCRIASVALVDGSALDKINTTSTIAKVDVRYSTGPYTVALQHHQRSMKRQDTEEEDTEEEERLVLKVSNGGGAMHGLAREGVFYAYAAARDLSGLTKDGSAAAGASLLAVLPRVVCAAGDMAASSKTILMEDLSTDAGCVQAGYFFGAGNPNNWGKDLKAERRGFALTADEVTALSFSVAAKLHAPTWNNVNTGLCWLRGAAWHEGWARAAWQASQDSVRAMWAGLKENIAAGTCKVRLSAALIRCMDASIAKANWDAFQAELAARPHCLTHGDFHPANFMVRPKAAAGGGGDDDDDGSDTPSPHAIVLIDWECVGVGSGPQDLGQFMISHVDSEARARMERGAVAQYYAELKELNPDGVAMTLDECFAEYVQGGLGRWLWFVPMLVNMCPPKMGQFFVDQVAAFIATHEVTEENVPIPRA